MAKIIVLGAGVVGLGAAMLLAKDGHEVTVLERDEAAVASSADEAWSDWSRRGVNQFRLPHFFLARYHAIVERELPEVRQAMLDAGALSTNVLLDIPESLRGPQVAGDDDFRIITGRRPVIEAAIARVADETAGVDVRRGTTVTALVTGSEARPGVPHVVGAHTETGDVIADLVVDCTGRRSQLPSLLDAIGAASPTEELDDSGFIYYARHFKSPDGSVPSALGPVAMSLGSITSLTLPADNGTWGLVVVAAAKDRPLLGLRDADRWTTLVKSLPLVAHWLDGEPLDDAVTTMTKIEDRIRTFVVDDAPVATGVVAVGDAWACSNPTAGRGASIGMVHAEALLASLHATGVDDPVGFALDFHERTERDVRPWFEDTRIADRHRLAEIDAVIAGTTYEPDDDDFELQRAAGAASGTDPELLRAALRWTFVLTPLETSLTGELAARARALGSGWRDAEVLAPSREELVAIASA